MAIKQTNKETDLNKDDKAEIDYKAEYENLKNQFSEMQEQFKQFMKMQETKTENINAINENLEEDEAPIIPTNKLINVTNLFDGELNLIGDNNKIICFKKFGITLPITFNDLYFACNHHQRFASQGYFYIHNKEVIKSLYLEEDYKKIVNKSTIEHILKLDEKQIKDIITNTTETIRGTIVDLIVKGVKDNKPEYSNKGKIDLISELTDKDIFKLAQDLRELEKRK